MSGEPQAAVEPFEQALANAPTHGMLSVTTDVPGAQERTLAGSKMGIEDRA